MPDEEHRAKLIVPDTGPLITLAAADSLDYLLYPGVPVYVPDAVLYEATIRGDALGAQSMPRDLGERAAIEAIRHALVLRKDECAIFITEDDRLLPSKTCYASRVRNLIENGDPGHESRAWDG